MRPRPDAVLHAAKHRALAFLGSARMKIGLRGVFAALGALKLSSRFKDKLRVQGLGFRV